MKYTYIIIPVVLSLLLTSCFTKPAEPMEETPVSQEEIDESAPEQQEDEDNEQGESVETDETGTGSEDIQEDANTSEAQTNTQGEVELETGSGEASTDEQVIIEGYEEDLEALFNDILGE